MTVRSVLPLYRQAMQESWRAVVGWTLGVAGALLLYLPLFPAIGGSADMQALLRSLPPQLIKALGYGNIGTGSGYVHSTFFGLIGFALITIAATSWSSAAIAGAEETGSLELTLAHGVTRTQVVLERAAAIVTKLTWLSIASLVVVLALNDSARLSIEPSKLVAEATAFLGLALVTAAIGLAVGAMVGRRVAATGAAAGVAVVGYALNAIANQNVESNWLHQLSPYAWAFQNVPLTNGVDWAGLGLLYGTAAVLLTVAALALTRRDVGV